MTESSLITLKDKSVQNNVSFLKKKMGKKVIISAVVKANAYGHGIEQIVPLLEKHGINHYSVFSYNEAIRVYNSLTEKWPIMIMGWISDKDIPDAIRKEIEIYIFNNERLKLTIEIAKQLSKKVKIHLEVETGMNRSGLNEEELKKAITIIKENEEYIDIEGFCTHLAGAESISNHTRIIKQLKNYHKMSDTLEKSGLTPKIKHVANSAASFIYPKARMDMVRIGIMIYGFWSSTEVYIQYINNLKNKIDPLKRILGLESQIMSIKEVKIGEFIGYGISYLAQKDIKTALIPIGYSSGYSRSLSNKGRVIIRGQRCSVIGVVNMNMVIADITDIPDAKLGDQVVIIGKQEDLEIKVSAFSDISDELNYEVLAHLSGKIKRIVV